jgi:O-antigen/teichoic acid export membrane protein
MKKGISFRGDTTSPIDDNMDPTSSFRKFATGSYFLILDNLVNFGIGAIFWLVLAKIVDPVSIGQSMVVIALATTIVGFIGYGIQRTLEKYISEYNARNMPHTSRRVLKSAIKMSLIMSGGVALVLTLISQPLATTAYHDPSISSLLVLIILTYLPSQIITAVVRGAFIGAHMAKYALLNDVIFQISRFALVAAAVMSLGNIGAFGILVSFSISSILALAVSYLYSLPRALPKLDRKDEANEANEDIRHLIKFSGLNYLAVGLRTATAQIGVLILATQNFEWAAFYGIAALISRVVASASLSVSGALLPAASEQLVKGDKIELSKMINTAIRMSIFISGFSFTILMLEPSYFLNLVSNAYIEAEYALRILVIFSMNNAISAIFASLLNASNRTVDLAKIEIVSSVLVIMLTFILIPSIGLEGAALATLTGSACSLILSLVAIKREEKLSISVTNIVKPIVPIVVALTVGYILIIAVDTIVSLVATIVSYIVSSLVYGVIKKKELKELFGIAMHSAKIR